MKSYSPINSSESEQNPETGYETLGSTSSYKSTSGFETAGEPAGMHASSPRSINNDQNQNYGSGYGRNIKEEVSVSLKVKNVISYQLYHCVIDENIKLIPIKN